MDILVWKKNNTDILKKCCMNSIKYTYIWDNIINFCLRNEIITGYVLDVFSSICRAMNSALPMPINTVLYRGLKNTNNEIKLGDQGFSSFTLDINVARWFADKNGYILKYVVKDDDFRAIFLSSHYGTSKYDEEEILIGPGTYYEILEKTTFEDFTLLEIDIKFNVQKMVKLNYFPELDIKFNKFTGTLVDKVHLFHSIKKGFSVIIFPQSVDKKQVKELKEYNLVDMKFFHYDDLTYDENFQIKDYNTWGIIYYGFISDKYKCIPLKVKVINTYLKLFRENFNNPNWFPNEVLFKMIKDN